MKKKIIISISGGGVFDVDGLPQDMILEIRDFDVPRDWDGDVCLDNDGDRYQKITFGD